MNGVLPVDKPEGFTSFDVVAKLRGVLGQRKIGHGGTLDPMATGVLPLFLGSATKACDLSPHLIKRYEARVRMGIATDTGDMEGDVTASDGRAVPLEDIRRAAAGFVGHLSQLPPMYSAVKVNGQRLYDLARSGRTVERKPREIDIFSLEIMPAERTDEFCMAVSCSRGTYIRVLAEDIARAAGCLGTLSALRRTESGGFSIAECHTLDEIIETAREGRAESLMVSVERLFDCYGLLELADWEAERFLNGATLFRAVKNDLYKIKSGGRFLGLGTVSDDGLLRKVKQFT